MKILKTFFAVAIAVGFVSCGDSNNENAWHLNYSNNYTYVVNTGDSSEYVGAGAEYDLDVDLNAGLINISVSDLILGPSMSPVSLKIENTKYSISDKGAMVVSVPRFQSVVGSQSHEITSFNLTHMRRTLLYAGVISDLFTISYVVDGTYAVTAIQCSTILVGETTVTDTATGNSVEQTRPYYFYDMDLTNRTARFYIGQLSYNGNARSNNTDSYSGAASSGIVIEDIPFTISSTGVEFLATEDIVPKINGVVSPDDVIESFRASLDYRNYKLSVMFTIAKIFEVKASLNASGQIGYAD